MKVELIQKYDELLAVESVRVLVDLVDAAPQLMAAVKDLNGRYHYVNAGFCARVGQKREDVVGKTIEDFFTGDLAQSYLEQDRAVLSQGRPVQNHLELIVRADGSLGWYVTNKSVLRNDTGQIVGVAVLSVDLNSQVTSAHAGLAAVIERLRADVSHPWRVRQLAQIAGLSMTQLERLCRRTLGISPQLLIQRLRIEQAVRLIVSTKQPLGEISAACGFYDQASFTRQFQRTLGLTPGAYRRSFS